MRRSSEREGYFFATGHWTCLILTASLVIAIHQIGGAAPNPPLGVNVCDYGAAGNGKQDDTAAFQRAMRAVGVWGGGRVYIPAGNYRINGSLDVPPNVTLQGVWVAPFTSFRMSAPPYFAPPNGSVLLAYGGKGDADGTPLITLHTNSALDGIAVFYPDQTQPTPTPYPWCIRGNGDDCAIRNVLLVNPYQGVDFGTHPAGRHFIDGLYGQPLYKGLFIDQCYDIGRVENVHFWPFWNSSVGKWTSEHGTAFIIGRADWEYMFNCFCIWYKVGYHFIQHKNGPGNVVLTQCGADGGADGTATTPVIVDNCQGHAGISFVNGQFMGVTGVVVRPTNTGPVKFTACGFWGMINSIQAAKLAGRGGVTFDGCHFISWGLSESKVPTIDAACQGLIVTACDFMDSGKTSIRIEPGCLSAVIVANRLRLGDHIENRSGISAQVGLNAFQAPPPMPKVSAGTILLDDSQTAPSVVFIGQWMIAPGGGNFYLGTHWAMKGHGNARAIFRPRIPEAGRYAVYAFFGPDPNHDHASNEPVAIRSEAGVRTVRVDISNLVKGWWIKLGVYRFAAGLSSFIVMSNDANGNVLADAVKVVPVRY
ncbi:MAG: hypothetical protein M1330_01410 [Armatimonadetes bacterium]|nr:hypothetical protein [Armatimonadota bacterium]